MRVSYIHQDRGNTKLWLPGGRSVVFHEHVYSTNIEEEIKALDAHAQYGKTFKRVEAPEEVQAVTENEATTTYTKGPATTMGPHTRIIDKATKKAKRGIRGN